LALLATTVVLVAGCVSGSLDSGGGGDVLLAITEIDNPPITGDVDLGTCSISGADCFTNANCPEGEVCNPPVVTGECTISEWSAELSNEPLNPNATPPLSDVFVYSVTLNYFLVDGVTPAGIPERVVPVSVTVPTAGSATVEFFPLAVGDLTTDNVTINVTIRFTGVDNSQESVSVMGGEQLLIEDCM
jgi:hypothetical protein